MLRDKLLMAGLLTLACFSQAHASTIDFKGSYQTGRSSFSFDGIASNTTGLGNVTVSYFQSRLDSPIPVFGTETISGPAIFQQFAPPYGPHSLEFIVKISDVSSFELRYYSDLAVGLFGDPTVPIGLSGLVAVSYRISEVPLHSTAPMFGAAILALAAVTYGVRRGKAVAA